MSLIFRLRARVGYTTDNYAAVNDTRFRKVCAEVGRLPFFFNAWDVAKPMAGQLQPGDYIECDLQLCPWCEEKEDGSIHFAYKCNTPIKLIEEPAELGAYGKMSGTVTSLDVHVGCGKGNQVIAVDTELDVSVKKQFGGRFNKKLYRVHLIVRQSDMDVLKLKKGDRIAFDGLMDPSIEDRITFTKVFTVTPMGELANV